VAADFFVAAALRATATAEPIYRFSPKITKALFGHQIQLE